MNRRDVPNRPGWQPNFRSHFGYGGICTLCTHDLADHFWWEGIGDNIGQGVVGCHGCIDKICQDRKEVKTVSALNLCERCDSLMLGKAVATLQVQESPREYSHTVEICPACVSDFNDFMHSGPTRDSRPFREPYKTPEATDAPKELL